MPRLIRVLDDHDLPGWGSEPRSSLTDLDDTRVERRSDRRRAERRPQEGHRDRGERVPTSPSGVIDDSPWLTRAERRRRQAGLVTDGSGPSHRIADSIEMVPPAQRVEWETRARRRATVPRASPSGTTFARRRAAAAVALATIVVLLLWSFWPSQDSGSAGLNPTDLTAAVLQQKSDPLAAAEDLPSAPATTPRAGVKRVPESGTGKLSPALLPAIAAPTVNPNRTVRVGLQVEAGAGANVEEAAGIIAATLGDQRGWQTRDKVRFRVVSPSRVKSGEVDITIVLASPDLTDTLCAPLRTNGEVSCFNSRKVVLNLRRWTEGVPGYANNLAAYRQYMVNHEIGHGLYHGHVECPRTGDLAPVMLQQSKGLDGCAHNPWPTVG